MGLWPATNDIKHFKEAVLLFSCGVGCHSGDAQGDESNDELLCCAVL